MSKTPDKYSYQDLLQLENKERYSSLGKALLSTQPNAPKCSFGKSSRYQAQQVFQDKKLMIPGRHSPGPSYDTRDASKLVLAKDPIIKFDQANRITHSRSLYDHYNRIDQDFEPQDADLKRRTVAPKATFGANQRFKTNFREFQTPGPNYEPKVMDRAPSYTMPARRQQTVLGSTPDIVGPNTYAQQKDMVIEQAPKVSFTRAERLKSQSTWERNQTYDMTRGLGQQILSQRTSKPAFSIGKAKRDKKPSMFYRDMARLPVQVRIPHPQF